MWLVLGGYYSWGSVKQGPEHLEQGKPVMTLMGVPQGASRRHQAWQERIPQNFSQL